MQFFNGVDVVLLGVVASFGTAHAGLGKLIFHAINQLGCNLSIGFAIATQGENLRQVVAILLLHLLAIGIGVEIVVAVGQRHGATFHVEHIEATVFHVGLHANAKEWIAKVHVHVGNFGSEIGFLEAFHAIQVGHHGLSSLFVEAHTVHGHVVEVDHLLTIGAKLLRSFVEVVEQLQQLLAVGFGQVVKHAIGRILGCERVGFEPTSACILIEIFSG
ncbi:Uncharacterised protein [Chlamydia trachomatis]|nr:Uncharacterised protein [Chlamydia trachomatis]